MWSDGTPVTAQDFDYAFRRLFDPARAAEYAYLQYPIKNAEAINAGEMPMDQLGVRVIDDRTIEFTLEQPTPYFVDALAHLHRLSAAAPRGRAVRRRVGELVEHRRNGPYNIVEWIPNSYIHSVKSETYYDAANVQIAEAHHYALDDLAAALQRYRAGEFDIMTDFPTDQYQLLQTQYPGQAHVAPFLGIYYYVMNQNMPQLQDVNVRSRL